MYFFKNQRKVPNNYKSLGASNPFSMIWLELSSSQTRVAQKVFVSSKSNEKKVWRSFFLIKERNGERRRRWEDDGFDEYELQLSRHSSKNRNSNRSHQIQALFFFILRIRFPTLETKGIVSIPHVFYHFHCKTLIFSSSSQAKERKRELLILKQQLKDIQGFLPLSPSFLPLVPSVSTGDSRKMWFFLNSSRF